MLHGPFERLAAIAVTILQPRDELGERLWIAAVPIAGGRGCPWKTPAESRDDFAADFILHFEHIVGLKVVFLGQREPLSHPVEELDGYAPVCPEGLNTPVQHVTHAEIAAGATEIRDPGVFLNRRR